MIVVVSFAAHARADIKRRMNGPFCCAVSSTKKQDWTGINAVLEGPYNRRMDFFFLGGGGGRLSS